MTERQTDERARIEKLEAVVRELLENAGWANMDDDELCEEDRLGNGMAEVILRARAALKDAPEETVALNLEESGTLCHMLLNAIMDLEKAEAEPLQFTQRMRVLYLKLTTANSKLRRRKNRKH